MAAEIQLVRKTSVRAEWVVIPRVLRLADKVVQPVAAFIRWRLAIAYVNDQYMTEEGECLGQL